MSKNDVWLNRNGGQLSELDGTEWLYPPGAPSTGRAPDEHRKVLYRDENRFSYFDKE